MQPAHPSDMESQPGYPGWRVALVSHIGVMTGFATIFISSFSFMVKPLQQQFGWSREEVARAFSIAAISVAFGSPLMGRLFDRVEPRKLISAMMAAFGVGLGSLAFLTPHLGQLYAASVLIGIAGTGTYQLGYARVVSAWFERRLGAALSIVVAGSGVGSLVIPPLVQHLLLAYGWRTTYLALGALPLLIGAPLTFFFARPPGPKAASPGIPSRPVPVGLTWSEALRSRTFWLLVLGVCALSLSENAAVAHLAPMMSDRRFAPAQVAITASLLGASSVVGRFVLGWLLDYLRGSLIAVASLLAAGAGILLLAHAGSFPAAAVGALLGGLGSGCELDLIPYMLRRHFGLRAFSALYGTVYSLFAVTGAIAPLVAGHAFDATGSYVGVFSGFSLVTLGVAFAMFALPAYRFGSGPVNEPGPSLGESERILAEAEADSML